jgi:hypothetical protein
MTNNNIYVGFWIFPTLLIFILCLLFLMNPTVKTHCIVDIKWENYSCMWYGNELVSCPHPTHIDCEFGVPSDVIKEMIKHE